MEILAILTETLAYFLPGRAKDLSAPLYVMYSRIILDVRISCDKDVSRGPIQEMTNSLSESQLHVTEHKTLYLMNHTCFTKEKIYNMIFDLKY